MLLTPAQIKPKSFNRDRTLFSFSFFTRGGCASCLRTCLGARLLPQSYQYLDLSEGTDRVGGQLHGDNADPFSGVTKSGSVWRKVPESDARSVYQSMTVWLWQYEAEHTSILFFTPQPLCICFPSQSSNSRIKTTMTTDLVEGIHSVTGHPSTVTVWQQSQKTHPSICWSFVYFYPGFNIPL